MKRFTKRLSYNFVTIGRFTVIYLGCVHVTIFLQQHAIFSSFFTHVYRRLIVCFLMADCPAV